MPKSPSKILVQLTIECNVGELASVDKNDWQSFKVAEELGFSKNNYVRVSMMEKVAY
jgi:hypothetical protein